MKTQYLLSTIFALTLGACVIPASGGFVGASSGGNAPQGPAVANQEENLPYCQSSIDCDDGDFCKDRGDGIRLCMGDGASGQYCKSSIDCDSGMFCKNRGDGLKVCMGEGAGGDFCKSSIDCEGNMFCKDRGDGYRVCM